MGQLSQSFCLPCYDPFSENLFLRIKCTGKWAACSRPTSPLTSTANSTQRDYKTCQFMAPNLQEDSFYRIWTHTHTHTQWNLTRKVSSNKVSAEQRPELYPHQCKSHERQDSREGECYRGPSRVSWSAHGGSRREMFNQNLKAESTTGKRGCGSKRIGGSFPLSCTFWIVLHEITLYFYPKSSCLCLSWVCFCSL